MYPEKKRALCVDAEPVEGVMGDVLSSTFDAVIAVFSGLGLMEVGIICIETSLEAGSGSRWIENRSSDERRGVIAMAMQQVRQIRKVFAERRAQILDMIQLRVSSRQQNGVRGSGKGNLCIRPREDD